MADISFNPTFSHREFVDGPDGDRVRAAEPNGFNARFGAIEDDLRQMSTVVDQIRAAIAARGTGPVEHVLVLPPKLLVIPARTNWTTTASGAAQALDHGVDGMMEVALPDNVRLVSFRAMGQNPSGAAAPPDITLSRLAVPGGTPETLAEISGDTNPYDKTTVIDASVATTATATYRYLIRATVTFAPQPVTIAGFQIVYTSS
ncbi:hypothetical protein [Streptomyces hyaluromycini]|uniref:hypothetical protein n=1 Tax=Streptomyces hyaluromycini TaxID=1377993 RepID=UPI000B5CAC28|nr:hypothetical protein [Streptomyces hyaluromycini]